MKNIRILLSFLLLFGIYLGLSCDKNTTSSEAEINPLDSTPRENAEAEWAALFLSGELVAPDSVYNKVLLGLNQLQEFYASSVPEVRISFYYPTYYSDISIMLDDSARDLVRSGDYIAWDSLNQFYGVTQVDTLSIDHYFVATIRFSGRLNTSLVCANYNSLPGVWYADAAASQAGDRPKKYITLKNGLLSFLIRNAWGDCPAGCPYSHYFYFKQTNDSMVYVGDWNPQTTETPPEWWDEADDMFYEYAEYFRYFCGDSIQ